jgi:flagellar biogenesis protein FliO
MTPVLLLLLHGDNPAMELSYFWAAVMLALTPVLIFGTIAVWLVRKMWKDQRGTRNAERGTEGPA